MPLFKLVIAFLAVGGSSYALFHLHKVPNWMKVVVVLFAITAAIEAAVHLPKAVDGLRQAFQALKEYLPPVNSQTENSKSSYGQTNEEHKPREAPEPTLPQPDSPVAKEGYGIVGSWSGGGTVAYASGQRQRAHCRASYSGGGSSVWMSGNCATPSGSAFASASLRRVGANSYSGSFFNSEYNTSGTIYVTVHGNNTQTISVTSSAGNASLTLRQEP